jgi:hypothetical protein
MAQLIQCVDNLDVEITASEASWSMNLDGVSVQSDDMVTVNFRDIVDMIMLAIEPGGQFILYCKGKDAKQALDNINEVINASEHFEGSFMEILEQPGGDTTDGN